jgi:predicted outer membrane repeat protein
LQEFLRQFGGFLENRCPHGGGGIAESGTILVPVDLLLSREQEIDVFHGCFVDRHDVLSAR